MVSWSSGKLEEPSNRSNNAKPSALKQDFFARLDGAQSVYKTLQQLQELWCLGSSPPSRSSVQTSFINWTYWQSWNGWCASGSAEPWTSSMMQADITEGFMCYCPAPVQLLHCNCCQLQLSVIRHITGRRVMLPEGSLEPSASREGLLPPARGMQHNLLDLSEWPQGNLHAPAPCRSHAF